MLAPLFIGFGTAVLVGFLLTLRWLLRIVREALEEIAREEVKEELKTAIPKLSLGLARRAAKDVPSSEASIVEEWEARLTDESARPLRMLALAIRLYRHRLALAVEVGELVAEPSVTRPRPSPLSRISTSWLRRSLFRVAGLPVAIGGRLRSTASTAGLTTILSMLFTVLSSGPFRTESSPRADLFGVLFLLLGFVLAAAVIISLIALAASGAALIALVIAAGALVLLAFVLPRVGK